MSATTPFTPIDFDSAFKNSSLDDIRQRMLALAERIGSSYLHFTAGVIFASRRVPNDVAIELLRAAYDAQELGYEVTSTSKHK